MTGQSRLASLIEATANTLLGLCLATALLMFLAWLSDVPMTVGLAVSWNLAFTALSILRNYVVRRIAEHIRLRYNRKHGHEIWSN